MRIRILIVAAVLLLNVTAAQSQQPPDDPIGAALFAPELVMQHQQAIGLTDAQKDFLKREMRQAQLQFTELQWKLQDEVEQMLTLITPARVDEKQVLVQLQEVLGAEREVKRTQIALLVRIKNQLSVEQQGRLREIRTRSAPE